MTTIKKSNASDVEAQDFVLVRRSVVAGASVPSTPVVVLADSKQQASEEPGAPVSLGAKSQMLRSTGSRVKASLPPPRNQVPTLRHVIQFTSTSGSIAIVTAADLAGACGGMCTVSNSTFISWASSVRIHSVKVWPGGNSPLSTNTTAELNWNASSANAFQKDELKVQVLPSGIQETNCVVFKPPAKSLASDWFATNQAQNVFSLQCSIGSVIELDISFTLTSTFAGPAVTVGTATLGAVYYLALDGPATNKFPPVALPTTS